MDNVNTGGMRVLTSPGTANVGARGARGARGAGCVHSATGAVYAPQDADGVRYGRPRTPSGAGGRSEAELRAEAEAKRRAAAQEHAKRRERRRKAKWLLTAMLLMFSFVLIYVISRFIGSFFVVSEISISGDSPYTAQEIIDASGMSIGDSLYRADRHAAEAAISERLPYLSSVKVKIKLPSSVFITVESQSAMIYAEIAGEYYAFSDDMRVLERADSAEEFGSRGLLRVTLPPVGSALVGSYLTLPGGGDPAYIGELAAALEASELAGRIDTLFLDERFNIILSVDGRYRIRFGSDQNAADKALAAARVIEARGGTVSDGGMAEIDVSDPASVVVVRRELLDLTLKGG